VSCCCDNNYTLDGLYGLSGLNGLMGQLLKTGSVMRIGVAYNYDWTSSGVEAEKQGAGWLRSAILTQLQALGVFSSINIDVKPPQYQGFQDGYITVQVTISDDQSGPQNVSDMVQYAITAYAPGITISRIEHAIDYVAPGSVAQPTPPPVQQLPQPLGQPSRCSQYSMFTGDWVACQLGITPAAGMAAGALGTLVLFGGILAAVVLLKR